MTTLTPAKPKKLFFSFLMAIAIALAVSVVVFQPFFHSPFGDKSGLAANAAIFLENSAFYQNIAKSYKESSYWIYNNLEKNKKENNNKEKSNSKKISVSAYFCPYGYKTSYSRGNNYWHYGEGSNSSNNAYENNSYGNNGYGNNSCRQDYKKNNNETNENCYNTYLSLIGSANKSLYCALFDISDNLSRVFLRLRKKGISLKLFLEQDNYKKALKKGSCKLNCCSNSSNKNNNGGFGIAAFPENKSCQADCLSCLKSSGILRTDHEKSYMHNKYCIIDSRIVLTGSLNPTKNGFYKNNNDLLAINSKAVAKAYLADFSSLWNSSNKKGSSLGIDERCFASANNISVECFFCPGQCQTKAKKAEKANGLLCTALKLYNMAARGSYKASANSCKKQEFTGGKERIIRLIDSANKSVFVAAFSFTQKEIAEALVRAKKRGVNVSVVLEKRQALSRYSVYSYLKDNGIRVFLDKNKATMHFKFIVVDGKIVETGSYNYSKNANSRNRENFIIISCKQIAEAYELIFKALF